MELKIAKTLLTVAAVGIQWFLVYFQSRVLPRVEWVLNRYGIEAPPLRDLSHNLSDSGLVLTAVISILLGALVWYRWGRTFVLLLVPTIINVVLLVVTYSAMLRLIREMMQSTS